MDYNVIKDKYLEYVDSFDQSNDDIKRKRDHSIAVGALAEILAMELNLDGEKTKLLKIIGLLHDIGRFEQIAKYSTFRDLISIDHGDFGVEILFDDGLIKDYLNIREYDQIIYDAIKNHNKYKIADNLDKDSLEFAKMIRDLDKIDIYRVAVEYKDGRLLDKIASEVLNSIYKKESVVWTKENSQSDETLGMMSFIFDLNYKESIDILNQNNYFKDYINSIVVSKENREEFEKIKDFIRNNTNLII